MMAYTLIKCGRLYDGLVDAIQEHFILSEGIGIELHPDNVTPSVLWKLKEAGVTKISIGIQSFQEKFQRMLGRTNELEVSSLGKTVSGNTHTFLTSFTKVFCLNFSAVSSS